MGKDRESRPSFVETVIVACVVTAFVKITLWDLYNPSIETEGSQRLPVIEKRIAWKLAIGSERLIEKIAPWISDDQIDQISLGSLEIAGGLIIDEKLEISDQRFFKGATK